MIKHPDGVDEKTGEPRFRYEMTQEEFDGGHTVALLTGPIGGTIGLADGTAYDVSEGAIAVKPEHLEELTLSIHKAHHAAGRFLDSPLPS
jgi:hypothetical protein